MKRIIRLTESDLTRIVRRVLREQDEQELMNDPAYPKSPKGGNWIIQGRELTDDEMKLIPKSFDHVVQKGETLTSIAKKYGIKTEKDPTGVNELLSFNPQYRDNPNLIKVGEKVRIAAGTYKTNNWDPVTGPIKK